MALWNISLKKRQYLNVFNHRFTFISFVNERNRRTSDVSNDFPYIDVQKQYEKREDNRINQCPEHSESN